MLKNHRKIQTHPVRVSLAGYQTALKPENDEKQVWRVIVHPRESVLCEGVIRTLTTEETRQEFQAAHSLAGGILSSFLRNNPASSLEAKLNHLTGREVQVENLSGDVDIHYFANGLCNVVYRVTFQEKMNGNIPLRFVMKIPKSRVKSTEKEMLLEKRILEKVPGFIPRLGDLFETEQGLVYFEEEINGQTLDKFLINGELPQPLLQKTVRTLISVYHTLGVVPTDIHIKNLMVRDFGKDTESIVMVDFCEKHLTKPHEILETLNFHYGMPGWVWDKHYSYFRIVSKLFSLWVKNRAPSEKNRLIFEAILQGMGETAGRNFLEEALRRIKQKDPNILSLLRRYPFDGWWIEDGTLDTNWVHEEGRGVGFFKGKLKRNISFIEMIRHLESYLSLLQEAPRQRA
jgi:serine/threonine protein kinase